MQGLYEPHVGWVLDLDFGSTVLLNIDHIVP